MKPLFTLLVITAFFACNKKDNTPVNAAQRTFTDFIGKYLVCDSIRVTQNGISTLTVVGKGRGADVIYSSNGIYQVYQSPPLIRNYLYEAPDKVYYWSTGSAMQATQFTRILSIKGNKIISTDTEGSPSRQNIYYHTAE